MTSTDGTNEAVSDNSGPLGYAFAVADTAWCCWEFDHRARTLEYLDGFDPAYFSTMAEILGAELGGSHAHAASVTLRMLYIQASETLLGLLGATLQAPHAVAAWIAACRAQDLDALTRMLLDERPMLTQAGRKRVSFVELSEHVHQFSWSNETGDASTAARFGRFWRRLAADYLDERVRAEYNALKHGHRVRSGGFSLAIGLEEVPGVPAPADAMRSLGGSEFGTTFFKAERVGVSKHHIRTRRTSVNWSARAVANRLLLTAMSLVNVVGALRCQLGIEPSTVLFQRPVEADVFNEVWIDSVGVRHSNMDSLIQIGPEDEVRRDALIEELESRARTD